MHECVIALTESLSDADRAYIKTNDAVSVHHFTGRSIRNAWDLWNTAGELNRWFQNTLGISHADDISGTILAAVWAKVRNKPFNAWEHVKQYKRHWLSMGVTPIGQNPLTPELAQELFRELSI